MGPGFLEFCEVCKAPKEARFVKNSSDTFSTLPRICERDGGNEHIYF